ncbi:hypothetical protein KIW84_012318 [Lathyrus oleraceus]|uniref:3-beta hydroxysteroid dehydrogenase/isomerase domain-containing protein n=1 Tax=Pisum sativum TaxID=3888 RepID=A0A9D5GWE5_PEA|nr:hypothetical protein KIW84_012318 [Pisum sativum]
MDSAMFSTCASFQRVGRSRTRNTVFLGDTSRRKRKSLCHRRSSPGQKKDVSFLTNLPGASEKLNIFNADPSSPESLNVAIEGCVGIFHTATPVDFEVNEPEEVVTKSTNLMEPMQMHFHQLLKIMVLYQSQALANWVLTEHWFWKALCTTSDPSSAA